jgi:hypothetical protein
VHLLGIRGTQPGSEHQSSGGGSSGAAKKKARTVPGLGAYTSGAEEGAPTVKLKDRQRNAATRAVFPVAFDEQAEAPFRRRAERGLFPERIDVSPPLRRYNACER